MTEFKNPLFNTFPREVGKYRKWVYSIRQLHEWVEMMNGVAEPYVSIYDMSFKIRQLFFDLDHPNFDKVLEEARKFYIAVRDMGYMVLPVYSGKKGFHIYIATKEVDTPGLSIASSIVGYSQLYFVNNLNLKLVDNHCIGNVRQMARHPNTVRLHKPVYAIPLPEEWVKWSKTKLLSEALEPHPEWYEWHDGELFDPLTVNMDDSVKSILEKTEPILKNMDLSFVPDNIALFLEALNIYPCVIEHVVYDEEPPHWARFELVAQLRLRGFSPEYIQKIIERLGWIVKTRLFRVESERPRNLQLSSLCKLKLDYLGLKEEDT